jgi:hypothetical protein
MRVWVTRHVVSVQESDSARLFKIIKRAYDGAELASYRSLGVALGVASIWIAAMLKLGSSGAWPFCKSRHAAALQSKVLA